MKKALQGMLKKTPPAMESDLILNSSYLTHVDVKFSDVKKIFNKGKEWDINNQLVFRETVNNPNRLLIIDNNTKEDN